MLCPRCGTHLTPEHRRVWDEIRANRPIESATPSSPSAPALPGVTHTDGVSEGDPAAQGVEVPSDAPWAELIEAIGAMVWCAQSEQDINCLYDQMTEIRSLAQQVRQLVSEIGRAHV